MRVFGVEWGRLGKMVILVFFFCALGGFHLIGSARWQVSRDEPTLWLDFDKNFIDFEFEEDGYSGDKSNPFAGIDDDKKMRELLRLVVADFNGIKTSYLKLRIVPVGGEVLEDGSEPTDLAHTSEASENKTIKIRLGNSDSALAGGEASQQLDDEEFVDVVGCKIVIAEFGMPTAKEAKTVITHEIGHCLGLAHNHADRSAIMGYNTLNRDSLGLDDKMGITYLYPLKPEYAEEAQTLGLACSRR